MNMMEYNVNVKQASIRLRERDVYKVQIKSTDMVAFSQMERLMKVWEEVRELKVSIICYVNEIDHHGDHYLGDLDLRKVVAGNTRRPVGWIPTAAAAAPPLPPRPVKTGKPGQKPHFCLLEMRVPTSVACTPASPVPVRKVSTGSNTLTPLNDGPAGAGFQRSTSQGYSSMQTPDGEFCLLVHSSAICLSHAVDFPLVHRSPKSTPDP